MAAPVRVLLFATAREAVGRPALRRSVPPEGQSLPLFLEALTVQYPALRPVLQVSRIAQNGALLPARRGQVRGGDEIAIYPPYSGG